MSDDGHGSGKAAETELRSDAAAKTELRLVNAFGLFRFKGRWYEAPPVWIRKWVRVRRGGAGSVVVRLAKGLDSLSIVDVLSLHPIRPETGGVEPACEETVAEAVAALGSAFGRMWLAILRMFRRGRR